MDIKTAVSARRSVRAFTDQPVPLEVVMDILERAGRAPSGSNLQPWRVYVLAGAALAALIRNVHEKMAELPRGEGSEYPIHPPNVNQEPLHSRYMRASALMYTAAGIAREDSVGRQKHLAKNWSFFGAPVGLIFSIDRSMGLGQWMDVGMYLQNVMLLALQYGLDTCAQEAWALWPGLLKEFLRMPQSEMVMCGMALGYGDKDHRINRFASERASLREYVTVVER